MRGCACLMSRPCIAGAHACHSRATHQPRGQWRNPKTASEDPVGGDAVLFQQLLHRVDAAMRRAPRRKRLVAELGNAPDRAEQVERRRIDFTLEEREITELSGDRRARAGHAAARELDCGHRIARRKAHLHRQLRAGFGMRLHRAAALPVINADSVAQPFALQPRQHRQTNRGAEPASIGRPEKPHRRARAQPQCHGDIDRNDNGAD